MTKFILPPLVAVIAILVLGCSFGYSWGGAKVSPEPIDPACYNRGDGCRFEHQKPDEDYSKYGQNPIWSSDDICHSRCVVKNGDCVLDEVYQESCLNCLEKCSNKNFEDFDKIRSCQEKCNFK